MSFLTPIALVITAVATLVITALHFLSVRRPPVLLLPTARFVVARDVRAVSRNTRPSDLLLLLLRLLALWCAGIAMAGPRWTRDATGVGHVIVADAALRNDSVSVARRAGVVLDGVDVVRFAWSDSVRGLRAELGAAWPLAWRTAANMVVRNASLDSVAVHVVVPAGGVESAHGWEPWRRTWPGRVQIVAGAARVAPSATTPATPMPSTIAVTGGPADDVVRAAFDVHLPAIRRVTPEGVAGDLRVRRSASEASGGSATPAAANAAVLVNWPVDGVPAGWSAARDSAGALVVRGTAIVAPWTRASRAPRATAGDSAGATRVIARWNDGTPAAMERSTGTGSTCVRDVGILVPNGSDVLLAPSGRALIAVLAAPCGALTSLVPARITRDSGGATSLASASTLRELLPTQQSVTPRWLPALLLALAVGALLLEFAVRGGRSGEARS